jgi:hypothetical protein
MKNAKTAADPFRRSFFRRSGAIAGGVVTGTTLAALGAHAALARNSDFHDKHRHGRGRRSTYGELKPTPDQNGDNILALPKDFRYVTSARPARPSATACSCRAATTAWPASTAPATPCG